MKTKTILFTALALFLLIGGTGCEDKQSEIINPAYIDNAGTLLGTWYWEKSYVGGEPGPNNLQTPQNTGIIKLLTFNNDSSWVLKEDSKETRGEKFSLGSGVIYDPYMTKIEYDSIAFYQNNKIVGVEYFELHANSLDFCGCFVGLTGSGIERWKYIREN